MVPARHVIHQGRVLASLGATVIDAARKRAGLRPRAAVVTPGTEIVARVAPPPPGLVRDYLRFVGGDADGYRGRLPPHLFPQWSFPVAARTLRGLPHSLLKVVNAGCRLEVKQPLPAGEPLLVRARLLGVQDDGRRAVLHQQVVTGTERVPDALLADLFVVVPSVSGERPAPDSGSAATSGNGAGHGRARVPVDARELAFWRLPANAGLRFAYLTGDFNPIHWVHPYARAFGHRSPILHGFCTLARTWEGLARTLNARDPGRLRVLDVRFIRALPLPARVGLYLKADGVTVGDAPGGPAYLQGTFSSAEGRQT
jgi:hypothetical protein